MADKKKGGDIDFDIDNMDDLDWPDFNFDDGFEEPKDDRSPVRKVASTAMKATAKTVADPARIRKTLTRTMPGAYSDAVGVGFDAASNMKDVFDAGMGEVSKTKQDLQRSLRRTLPKVRGSVPDKLGKILDKLAGTEDEHYRQKTKQQERDEDIAGKLDEIMGVQNEQNVADKEINEARRLNTEVVNRKRFTTQMAALTSMDTSLRRLSDYNEGIDARWKRKTLELQLSQNYMMADLVDAFTRNSQDSITRLDAIAKNTALPEAVKITKSEEFTRLTQQRLLGHISQGLSGNLGEYLGKVASGLKQRMTTTVADRLRKVREGFSDASGAAGDIIQMQNEMKQNGGEDDSLGTILELALGAGSDWASNKYGDKVKSKLGATNLFGGRQGFVRNAINNGGRILEQEAGKRNTHRGVGGTLLDMARSLLPTTRIDGSIKNNDLLQGHMPDNFNQLTNRSIIDVIPGLLSRIHHEVVKMRTGDDDVPMIRYDMSTGTFTDAKTMIGRIKGTLFNEGQEKYNVEGLDKIVDLIDTDKTMTPAQRKVLQRHLAESSMRNKHVSLKGLATGDDIMGPGSAADKAAIRDAIIKSHGFDLQGNSEKFTPDQLQGKNADIGSALTSMRWNFTDPTGPIKALIDSGYKEELLAAGILVNKGGRIAIDHDKFQQMRLEGQGVLGSSMEDQAYSPRGSRSFGGGKGAGNKATLQLSNSVSALAAAHASASAKAGLPGPQFDYGLMGDAFSRALKDSRSDQTPVDAYVDKMDQIIEAIKGMNDTYNSGYQTLVLEEIMDILQDGRQFANVKVTDDLFIVGGKQLGTEGAVWKNRLGRAKTNVMGKLSAGKNWAMGKVNWAQGKAQKALSFGREKAGQAATFLDNLKGQVVDIYVKGWESPALEARKIAAGRYIDKTTGKVIKKLSDIRGEVEELMEDGSSRVVLTLEDIKQGIHDRLGRRITMASLKGLRDAASGLMDKVGGKFNNLRKTAQNLVKGAKDWAWGKLAGLHDVYVKGEDKPRLLKFILDQGGYIDAATGNVIKKLSDIKGDVKDLQGNVVLSLEDMRKGLMDQYGNAIRENWAIALGRITRVAKGAKDLVMKGLGKVKSLGKSFLNGIKGIGKWGLDNLKGMGTKISNWFSDDGYSSDILKAQLEVQVQILQKVAELSAGKRKRRKVGDQDGDGIVEGSWQDILRKRDAKKKEDAEKKGEGGADAKGAGGLLGKLTAAIGGLGGKIKDLFKKKEDDEGGIGIDDVADAADIASHGKGVLGKLKNWGGRGLRAGGRLLGKIPGVKAAGRLLGRIPGVGAAGRFLAANGVRAAAGAGLRMAGGWALRGAIGAGAVAAGIISAPVAAVAGAVIGAATLAWMAYKWYDSSKSRPLQKLRLMQYGWTTKSDDDAKKFLAFEEKILKHAKMNGTTVDISSGGDDAIAALKEFGIDPEKDHKQMRSFEYWFDNRFRPVFTTWFTSLNNLKLDAKLPEVDDKLKPENKLTLLAAVKDAGKAAWAQGVGPAEDMGILTNEKAITDQAEAARKEIEKDAPAASKQTQLPLPKDGNATSQALAAAITTGAAVTTTGQPVTPDDLKGGGGSRKAGPAAVASGKVVAASLTNILGAAGAGAALKPTGTGPKSGFPEALYPKTTLDALRTIRMRAYGLITLDTNVVNALLYLEWCAQQKMKASSDGSADYDGDMNELIAMAGPRFHVGEQGSDSYQAFLHWLDARFLPVWKAYVGTLKVISGNTDPLWAHERAKPAEQYKLAEAVIGAGAYYEDRYVAVWKVPLAPMYGDRPNTDSSTVADNMKTLIQGAEKQQLDEVAGAEGKVKSSTLSGTKGFFANAVDTVKGWFGGGNDKSSGATPSADKGNWFTNLFKGNEERQAGGTLADTMGQKKTDMYNAGATGGSTSTYNPMQGGGVSSFDPNGGPGGNVNDLPMPTARKGFDAHKDLIAAVAKMTGFDPGVLSGLMATESGFDSGVKNSTGSATGLGQFISGTWKAMVAKYGPMFGIKPGADANDPRANALMTAMYMKDNAKTLKQLLGRDNFTDVDLYNAHFLGAGGYAKALKNLDRNGADVMPKEASYNKSIFWVGGDKNKPRTFRQILELQGQKQIKNRNTYGPMMNAYLASKGEKVDNSLYSAKEGVQLPGADKQQMAKTDNAPNPDAGAVGGGGPEMGPAGDKPKEAVASTARQANAGGSDITTGPSQSPEMLAAAAKPAASGGGSGGGASDGGMMKVADNGGGSAPAATPSAPDPAQQAAAKAQAASAQQTSPANTMGGDVGQLVGLGQQQVAIQKAMLQALQTLVAASNIPSAKPAGPMSVKAPQSV